MSSISSLPYNPTILDLLPFGGGGGGITALTSPDGNLDVVVVGATGQISLKNSINVGGTVSAADVSAALIRGNDVSVNTVSATDVSAVTVRGVDISGTNVTAETALNCLGVLNAGVGLPGAAGQLLASQGAGLPPIWTTPTPGGAGLRIAHFAMINCDATWTGVNTLYTSPITGLTAGKNCYVLVNFTCTYGGTGSANTLSTTTVQLGSTSTQAQAYWCTSQLNGDNVVYEHHVFQVPSTPGDGATQTLTVSYNNPAGVVFAASTQLTVLVIEDTA